MLQMVPQKNSKTKTQGEKTDVLRNLRTLLSVVIERGIVF